MADAPDTAEQEAKVSLDLVSRIRTGDRSAEEAMVRRYSRGLLFLLRRKTGDEELAKDMRQETFRRALETLKSSNLKRPERLAAYLRGIANNVVLEGWRQTDRRKATPDLDAVDAAVDDRPGPFENVTREQTAQIVRTLVDELRVDRDREVLVRLYLRDEDREEICADLGIDSAHLNRVLFRAKQRFRDLLLRAERKHRFRLVK